MLTGLYVPGDSIVHRAPAGGKLLALLLFSLALVGWPSPPGLAAGAVLVVVGYAAADLRVRHPWAQVWPLRWFALVLAAVQWWADGPARAVVVAGTLVVMVAAAGLVTLTTPLEHLMDAVIAGLGPTRRLGVDPERVGLLVALAIRAIPVVSGLVDQAREARAARGLDRSVRALLVPVVVRAVLHAQRVGDALVARGVDD